MSFSATNKTVKSIFEDISSKKVNNTKQPSETYIRKFIIPDFQRKYAWSIEQFDEFWTDLTSVHHQTFFGTFLAKDTSNLDHNPNVEIVDGQQRLTTITIFKAVTRNILLELAQNKKIPPIMTKQLEKLANDINSQYINLLKSKIVDGELVEENHYLLNIHKDKKTKEPEKTFQEMIKDIDKNHLILEKKFKANSPEKNIQNAYFFFYKKILGHREDLSLQVYLSSKIPDKKKPKIKLKSYDFDKSVYKYDKDDEGNKVIKSDYFNALAKQDASIFYTHLENIENKFETLLSVWIQITDAGMAYEYFESVNARGVDLTVGDLLKNLIFSKLKDEDTKEVCAEYWEDTIKGVLDVDSSTNAISNFFRYFWASTNGYIPVKQLFKEIKSKTSKFKKEKDWENFCQEIFNYGEIYSKLLNKDVFENEFKEYFPSGTKTHEKVFRSIVGLRSSNTSLWTVIAMTILYKSRYEDRYFNKIPNKKTFSKFDYIRFFEALEKFIFSYSVVTKSPSNWVWVFVCDVARQLRDLSTKDQEGKWVYNFDDVNDRMETKYYKKINNKIPTRAQFIKDVSVNIKYSQKNRPLCHYYLHEIERITYKNENIKPSTATVEHIVPRSPSKWGMKAKEIKLLHNIGNLIFLEKKLNESIQNKNYDIKLEKGFKKSKYEQVSKGFLKDGTPVYDFKSINKNNMAPLEQRNNHISETMADIWVEYLNKLTS